VIQAGRFATAPEGVRAFAEGLGPADEVALKATGNTWAIATLLASRAGRVVVSNPVKTRAIAEAKVKTDKVDAESWRSCWPRITCRRCGGRTPLPGRGPVRAQGPPPAGRAGPTWCDHLHRPGRGQHLAGLVGAVAHHQPAPGLVALADEPGDVGVHLGLQRLDQHPPGSFADDPVEQPHPLSAAGVIGVGGSRNHGEHGSYPSRPALARRSCLRACR
jgi:hypothetical protein